MKIFFSILLIVALGLVVAYIVPAFFTDDTPPTPETPADFANLWETVPTSDTLNVGTKNGGTLSVQNFLSNNETTKDVVNPNNYVLAGSLGYCLADGSCPAGYETDRFQIRYDSESDSFTVSLLTGPLSVVRREAEAFLLSRLGIEATSLCDLRASVMVPFFVNQEYAGQQLGFSNCPNAVPL